MSVDAFRPNFGSAKTIKSFAKTQAPGGVQAWPVQGQGCPCIMWPSGLPKCHMVFGLP